ncbi:hypothetical protein KI372_00440 [Halobacterium salinarum]|uniref:hypothetical protein n=1 Tax=Halobacterium salinarum TaxID=2242 RepID=UPI001F254F37|nr:hypothetical protein [Halobacterium salinarum]MCF2206891.1 hypothetical protein [Halobacterium salinarum]MCF2239939.1 hypothetical protein [Halobacterium salinarum]
MTKTGTRQGENRSRDYLKLLQRGSKHGILSWFVGIIISFVLFRNPSLNPGQGITNANIDIVLQDVPSWKLSSYTYYGGHFVEITPEDLLYSSTNIASHLGGIHLLGFIVPVAVLVLTGYYYTQAQNPTSLSDARIYGASIVGGYALLMLLGVFLFNHSQTDGYGNQWALTLSTGRALIIGILYPIVFGAIGGHLAYNRS